MGTSNFVAWDAPQVNIESDAQYAADSSRINGLPAGAIVPSPLLNKALLQATIMPAALGQMMAAKGFSTSDSNQAALAAVLANVVTTADQKSALTLVPYSPSITLNAAASDGFYIELTGNTFFTITGMSAGQMIAIFYAQDAVGGHAVTLPTNTTGAVPPDTTPNAVSLQLFRYDIYTGQLRAIGPLVSNDGIFTSFGFYAPIHSATSINPGPFFSGTQSGSSYGSTPATAVFVANTQGGATNNYLFSGEQNGANVFSVRADGLIAASSASLSGNASVGSLAIGGVALTSGPNWFTLPNGDIQQYGNVVIPAGSYTQSVPVTFPRAFPNSAKSIVATPNGVPGTTSNLLAALAIDATTTGFVAYVTTGSSSQTIAGPIAVNWIAIGN